MPFEIKKPDAPKKTFVLARPLHLTADEKVVEESDPAGVKVLGGAGYAMYEEEAKHYGLTDEHRAVPDKPDPVPDTTPEKPVENKPDVAPEVEPEKAEEPEIPDDLKGKLPADLPGHAALAEAGINTYNQLRKALADDVKIPGIGDATRAKIIEALNAVPEE